MSCENTSPCGCNSSSPCGCKISSDDVAYQGPNLGCTDIITCDSITAAIQKLDEYACSIDLVQNIITNITNNISLYNQFVTIVNQSVDCSTVFDCLASTTTTTTTTLNCGCVEITIEPGDLVEAAGNTNPAVDGVIFIGGPKDILCDGGSLPSSYDAGQVVKYCVDTPFASSISLFYYKNDGIITNPDISSTVTILEEDCSETGTCLE
jgi:hypothetical protein